MEPAIGSDDNSRGPAIGLDATTPLPSSSGASPAASRRYAKTELASGASQSAALLANEPKERAGTASETLGAGDIIAGKYQIERVLGEGGMGMVFAATHLQLREPVALKFMNAAAVANPEASARFVREARAAARLRGEHICRVLDLGETEDGDRYIVIEYLDGRDLAEVLAERQTLTVSEAVDYILQACEAMAEAHKAGIVHRDLKPANLFLTTGTDGNPCIKVVDFGISKLVNPETNAAVVTTTRSLMGSPLYMAPEQLVSAKDVDARSDIWALGTVLFQLIAGRTPYEAASLPEVVAQVLHNDPPKLSSVVAAAPRKLDSIIARCLAKKREDRYDSVADLAADLAEVVPESSHLAMRSAAVLGAARHSTAMPASNSSKRRRTITIAALASVVVIAAAISIAVLAGGSTDKTDKTAPAAGTTSPAETKPSTEASETTTGQPATTETTRGQGSTIEVDVPTTDVKPPPEPGSTAGNKAAARKAAARKAAARKAAAKKAAAKKAAAKKAEATKGKGKTSGELLEPDVTRPTVKKPTRPKSEMLDPE